MAYHPLANDSGGSADSRVAEARKLVNMLAGSMDQMTDVERRFVESMDECDQCSPKQLFWLRDLHEKYD